MGFQLKLFLLTVLMLQLSEASWLNSFNSLKSTTKSKDNSTIWAILVAGSYGYSNYRHQADVCHAYQILKRGGLKDENIIVFMYDDIANNIDNPRQGVIINHPKGSDVYKGVPKDYTGKSVNANNLYAVLLGDVKKVKGGSGKVLASKPDDKIFIYYSDHGGPGVLGMPVTPFIFADQFIHVLKTKHASGTYDEMVIYLESCESGSIFEGLLPRDLDIYVTTASSATENSWATYCPKDSNDDDSSPEDTTCLGDLYSVSWMEDSDSEDLKHETLEQQYLKVKKRTSNDGSFEGSHVMEYGTLRIKSETVSVYQGSSNEHMPHEEPISISTGVVNQRDADLYSMWRKYNKSTEGLQQKEELLKEIKEITAHRAHLDNSVKMIKHYLLSNADVPVRVEGLPLVDDWECLRSMVRAFETYCGSLTQYGMKHTRTFANLCNNGVTEKDMEIATKRACSSYKMGQFNPAIVGYSASSIDI